MTFARVAVDFRFAPEQCTPRRANQKGTVENLVGFDSYPTLPATSRGHSQVRD